MPKRVKQAAQILGPTDVVAPAEPVVPTPPSASSDERPTGGRFEPPPGMQDGEVVANKPPVVRKAVKSGKTWRFVKNIDTDRPLKFFDGSTYVFSQALLVTSDENLAAKIISVAKKNHVCIEPRES